MSKILSISIAAYNVETYIRNTLDSLIDPEIIDDIEVFVVDDGGKDGTLDIVKEYSDKYPGSVFGVHKENGGYGSVINKSVELATGKYFKQLDGDDWFDTENLKKLVALLKTIDTDAVYTQTNEVYEGTDKIVNSDLFANLEEGKHSFSDADFQKPISMHSTTVKTKILKDMKLSITEHCFYTDVEYVNFPLPYLKSFYVCHFPVYMYRLGREGQSVSPEGIKKHYKEHEKVFFHIADVYNSLKDKNKKKLLMLRLRKEVASQCKYYCMLDRSAENKKQLKEFVNRVEEVCPRALSEAKKYSRFVKLLCGSKFMLYPFMKKFM
ncbi:MAG TPA: glycosyltransferase family 2 protein [Ruminococcus sp.]|mgnify:FL=1|nr:glycosyltransferase family 2 protein [Ruminococcus sp.]